MEEEFAATRLVKVDAVPAHTMELSTVNNGSEVVICIVLVVASVHPVVLLVTVSVTI